MREVLIPAKKGPGHPSPAAVPVVILQDSIGREGPKPEHRPRANRRQRDFIVRYDGKFLCHYRARRILTARMAFGQIARELRARIPDFAPEKLALYRPVKLAVRHSGGAEADAAGGEFVWFESSQGAGLPSPPPPVTEPRP